MKGSRDFKQNCFFSSYSGAPGIRHIWLFSPNSISKNNKVKCIQYSTDCDFGCCLMFLHMYLHLCVCVFMGGWLYVLMVPKKEVCCFLWPCGKGDTFLSEASLKILSPSHAANAKVFTFFYLPLVKPVFRP